MARFDEWFAAGCVEVHGTVAELVSGQWLSMRLMMALGTCSAVQFMQEPDCRLLVEVTHHPAGRMMSDSWHTTDTSDRCLSSRQWLVPATTSSAM
jgi:hypothetical protein